MMLCTCGDCEFERRRVRDFRPIEAGQVFSRFLLSAGVCEPPTGQEVKGVNLQISCRMNLANLHKRKPKEHWAGSQDIGILVLAPTKVSRVTLERSELSLTFCVFIYFMKRTF